MKMRKHNYVVGFVGDNQAIYGKDQHSNKFKNDIAAYVSPMTILQAIQQLKTLTGKKKVIYKLVEVDQQKEKFKQKIIKQMSKP